MKIYGWLLIFSTKLFSYEMNGIPAFQSGPVGKGPLFNFPQPNSGEFYLGLEDRTGKIMSKTDTMDNNLQTTFIFLGNSLHLSDEFQFITQGGIVQKNYDGSYQKNSTVSETIESLNAFIKSGPILLLGPFHVGGLIVLDMLGAED